MTFYLLLLIYHANCSTDKTIFDAIYREPFLLVLAQGTVLLPVTQLARANTRAVRTAEVVLATTGSLVTPVRTLNRTEYV